MQFNTSKQKKVVLKHLQRCVYQSNTAITPLENGTFCPRTVCKKLLSMSVVDFSARNAESHNLAGLMQV